MKVLWVILATICLGLTYGYSQTKKLIYLPVLKERPPIDSLIDLMINYPTIRIMTDSAEMSKDDWITLTMEKAADGTLTFWLGTESKGSINYTINQTISSVENINHKRKFGYFTYRKFKVFAWTDESFYNFFSKSNKIKSYDYIYRIKGTGPDEHPFKSYKSGTYIYKKNEGFKPLEIAPVR